MKTDERIDRLEKEIEKLKTDYSVLKYVIDKESLADQLVKIVVNNASQQLPELIKLMEIVNVTSEEKPLEKE